MAASDHLHPEQMRMFMTARELHGMHSIDVQQTPESRFGGHWKSMDAMWKTKRRENAMGGPDRLDKGVAAHGVQWPVELTSGTDVSGTVISDGHHRIQAAYEANPDSYVPVEHSDLDQRMGVGRRQPVTPRFRSYP